MAACLVGFTLVCSPARAIEVEVTGLDGKTIRGELVQVMPEIILSTPEDEIALTWAEVLGVRPLATEKPSTAISPGGPLRFELADGSCFDGRLEAGADRGLTVALRSGQSGRLEPGLIRAVYSKSASASARLKLNEISAEKGRTTDVVIVERGPELVALHGALRRIDSEQVLFEWKERELPLPWERIAGLSLAPPLPRRSSCEIRMQDGDVLTGRIVVGDTTSITLQSAVFDALVLPWSHIQRIECRSGRMTFVSDLAPERYEFTPFFQKQWNYACDKTLTGRPIRLAGQLYDKGVTMHSRSSLVYELRGQYRQFAAVVGIVDEMEDRGDAALAVLGDGRILWEAVSVRGGAEPREVLVDVTGVRELSLHVDFGEALDLSDHVCWALARLIR